MKWNSSYPVDYSARDPKPDVDPIFSERWSPRSLSKVEIPGDIIQAIIDAARWSPSCYNEQPWLIVTSSNPGEFEICLDLLKNVNQRWAKNASVIGFIFGKRIMAKNGKKNGYSAFDCGAASLAIALQARRFGLHTHVMAGIHKTETYGVLGVSEVDYECMCGFTIGLMDTPDKLPEELAAREKPPVRKPLSEIWKHGFLK